VTGSTIRSRINRQVIQEAAVRRPCKRASTSLKRGRNTTERTTAHRRAEKKGAKTR
jgi:hypothetical protein